MINWLHSIGQTAVSLLRGETADVGAGKILTIIILFASIYGGVMGSYGGEQFPRILQIVYSGIKVPLLLLVTFLLSLPVYSVFCTLMGLRVDLAIAVRKLLATQAVVAILLAAFAPFTLLWYASTAHYSQSLIFNGFVFLMASSVAQSVQWKMFLPLISRDARHRQMVFLWIGIYAFVGIQLGWVLRPFLGNPGEPTTFFRQEAWGNAYEVVIQHLTRLFR